jgi:glycosyltransferase involved in cell wall biosynthesis
MKIAQVAPLYESVPPKLYGGTERVVSYLTEALVAEGHNVTLFASGDSQTAAHLIAPCPRSLRLQSGCVDPLAYHFTMLAKVAECAEEFDVIHFHIDYLHFPLSRAADLPQLTTLHGRLDLPGLVPLFGEYRDMPVVSISTAQRAPLPWLNWVGNVYHGLPADGLTLGQGGDYLAFLGRISPEKRLDRAIEIAVKSGRPLKIAAKVDKVDREYYELQIKPLLSEPGVEFLGEIAEHEKSDFLGNALALLFPVDWPEPFGLAMIEALACGTPVIAFRSGSIPEVLADTQSGIVVDSVLEAIASISQIESMHRSLVRADFERRFTSKRMAQDYVTLYEAIQRSRSLPRDVTEILLA